MRCTTVGRAIDNVLHASHPGAVRAAKILSARFHAVANDRHFAVQTARSEHVNGARKRIESVRGSTDRDVEGLVVRVATDFAVLHAARQCKRHAGLLEATGTRCCRSHMATLSNPIRMAVVGLGDFAQAVPAIKQLKYVEFTTLISGSQHKLDELLRALRHSTPREL